MTTLERKSRVKSMFAGEDIASILGEEEAGTKKSFKSQKQKNSELLTAYREKLRSSESSNELHMNNNDQKEMGIQKKETQYTRTNRFKQHEREPKGNLKGEKQRYSKKKKTNMTKKRYPRGSPTRRPRHM